MLEFYFLNKFFYLRMKDEQNSITNENSSSEKITNLNPTQVKKDFNFFTKDFLYFKNDILKELKIIDLKLESQNKLNSELKNTISLHDTKIGKLHNKLDSILNVINVKEAATNYYKEKIDILMDFKSKNERSWDSLDYKIQSNSEKIKNAINKYDKIIYDNLEYPGTIGRDKFKNFHELIDYILNNIKIFSLFKEKNEVDLRTYKVKLESIIKSINCEISGIIRNANSFTISNLKELENKCLNEVKTFNEKLMKLRVENLQLINNFENEKNQTFGRWNDVKNMKKELNELIESSIQKLNTSNNSIKETLDNYEKQFNEIRNDITSMKDLIGKIKFANNKDKPDNKIKIEKSDYFKTISPVNKKDIEVKKVQGEKSILQNYIEGNSFYQDLIEQNSLKCKQHEKSESSIKLMLRKYYDEGYNNIKDININKTLENIIKKNTLTERYKMNNSMNSTPKANINSNKIKQKLEGFQSCDNKLRNVKQYLYKNVENSLNNKFISSNNNYNKKNKTKSKDADKRILYQDKFTETFKDKSRFTKLKQLSSLSFLYDDIKNKKFPKIEINKIDEKLEGTDKIIKDKLEKLKFKEHSIKSGFKNVSHIQPKTQKIRHRINSSEIISHHYNKVYINIKENNKVNSLNNINMNNQHFSEKDKKLEEKLKKKRKSSESIKKSTFRLKSEKINKN